MDAREFLLQAHIDADVLEAWIEAGWVAPGRDAQARRFSAADVARAQLIRDLKGAMGVNDEGVTIILDLVDQIYGVRAALREIVLCLRAQPDSVQRKILADVCNARASRDSPAE
jgi:chaperone modulatory protein CbpM